MESYKNLQKQRAQCNERFMYHPQLQPESAGGQSCCIPTPASPIPTPDIVEQILDFKLVPL